MTTPAEGGEDEGRGRGGRRRFAVVLLALGVLVILSAVLRVASAGYGSRPLRELPERRSYDTVKRDVHRVLPWALVQGLAGLGLAWVGGRALTRER